MEAILNFVEAILNFVEAIRRFVEAIYVESEFSVRLYLTPSQTKFEQTNVVMVEIFKFSLGP